MPWHSHVIAMLPWRHLRSSWNLSAIDWVQRKANRLLRKAFLWSILGSMSSLHIYFVMTVCTFQRTAIQFPSRTYSKSFRMLSNYGWPWQVVGRVMEVFQWVPFISPLFTEGEEACGKMLPCAAAHGGNADELQTSLSQSTPWVVQLRGWTFKTAIYLGKSHGYWHMSRVRSFHPF